MTDTTVVDDAERSRFELRRAGTILSRAHYVRRGPVVTLTHVETPVAHRGQGHAAELMAGLLDRIRAADLRLRPLCPYAADYLREHPDQQDLLAT